MSATAAILAKYGISSPFNLPGYPVPSYFSWWCFTIGIMSLNISADPNICAPIAGWFFICEYSSSESLLGFNNILSGIPIFPISWNNPPTLKVFIWSSGNPNFWPIKTEYSETLSEWPLVYVSFASTANLKVSTISK